MKKYLFVFLLGIIFTAGCIFYVPYSGEEQPPPGEEQPVEEPRGYVPAFDVSYFYDYLSPFGMWVYYPPYGYVWIPRDTWYGWRPYTYGRWVWTDYGWTWVSHFKWGWAPFHYGRWGWDRELGWFWMPDTVWGPGWVTWRRGDFYIGWAPLPPEARFVIGVGIRDLPFSIPPSHWIFVEGNYFLEPSLHRHIFPFERNITIINYTVIHTNIYVQNNRVINGGIDIDHIRRVTKQSVSKFELKDAKREGESRVEYGNLEIYRPTIKESQGAKPKTILNRDEARVSISKVRIAKPREKELPFPGDKSLRGIHRREIRLVEQSQQMEVQELKKKLETEKEAAQTPEEKARIEKDYREKIANLQKNHEEEKSQIEKRHQEEEKEEAEVKRKEPEKKEEVKKGKIKKKQ